MIKVKCSSFLSKHAIRTLRQAKRLITLVVGLSLLIMGVVLIFLPGPAIVVIPIALAILATEFVWAKKLLSQFNNHINNYRNNNRKKTR